MEFEIVNLANCPEVIPQLAAWHHGQWAHLHELDSIERRLLEMDGHLGPDLVPSTWVARDGETVLGSAALVAADMDDRNTPEPWLASVFIDPKRRGEGLGSALVGAVMEQAQAAGWESIWLYTPDAEALYARLGWEEVERLVYHKVAITVMRAWLG